MIYNQSIKSLVESLESDSDLGLSQEASQARREKYGPNHIESEKPIPLWIKFMSNFKEIMVIILLVAAGISFALGEMVDAVIILIIVILNAIISTLQEAKAEKAIDALKSLSTPKAVVLRDGKQGEIDAREIVPGDIVLIDAGDMIPADGRLIVSASLKVEESALTGESLPVLKTTEVLENEVLVVGDQTNMVFAGTTVTYGRGKYIVTATGMQMEMGKIASLMMLKKEEQTPLQLKLQEIGKILGIIVLGVCALIFGIGWIQGRDHLEMFFTAVSLAVAAIPEGLPAVVTIVLAIGVQRLAKQNAIIRKLPAVETLGGSAIICSDKTGTLTQNKMTVVKDEMIAGQSAKALFVKGLVLCNDAEKTDGEMIGDPTETALIVYGEKEGYLQKELHEKWQRINEIPFDSERKLMTTCHQREEDIISFTKGAPDALLTRCKHYLKENEITVMSDKERQAIIAQNDLMAGDALRVLGLAYKTYEKIPDKIDSKNIETDLIFVGLVGMIDPPRETAKKAIEDCVGAGIKPIMITGDHPVTASAIARALGILKEGDAILTGVELDQMTQEELDDKVESISVYARVSPEHKVKIVTAWQNKDKVVAMTGDGVNDAPALRMAEIGIAMGKVGTDVSRNAADMVLMDDNFATIVTAIREGRGIYANIKRSIRYLLSCNIGEILVLFLAMVFNLPVPLIPVHILWVNLVTDSFPALALGMEPVSKDVMLQKPRPKNEKLFTRAFTIKLGLEGFMVGGITLLVFIFSMPYGIGIARTMAFGTLAFSQLVHANNVRSEQSVVFKKGLLSNRMLLLATAVSGGLQLIVMCIPLLRGWFKLSALNEMQWFTIMGAAILPLLIIEIVKKVKRT